MNKMKDFIIQHRTEMAFCAGIIFAYKLGFRSGRKATDNAVTHFVNESIRALELAKF